ncbi:MAG: hypothetical protein K2X32_07470, partial [Phycisphaerales bacterium]|nr:hypothetical protein [Phycisphaerales bacterium]
ALLRLSAAGVALVVSAALLVTLSQIMLVLLGMISRPGDLPIGVIGIGVTIILTVAGAVAMLVRDVMLRRRVRWVIKAKGTCAGCGYGLLGLPVPDDLRVTCPECGMEMWVDAALAELVTDEQGQRRLKPKPEKRVLPRWMNRRLAWNVGKVAAVVVLLAVVGGAGWWAWREHQLVEQAKVAKADLRGLKVIQEMNASQYPPVAPGMSEAEARAKDGWTLFDKVFEALDKATGDLTSEPNAVRETSGAPLTPEPSMVFDDWEKKDVDEVQREHYRVEEALARRLVARFDELGGDARLRAMIDAERAVRDWRVLENPGEMPSLVSMQWLGATRRVARACAAKMEIALERDDLAGYLLGLRGGLKLASMVEREPVIINRLVSRAIDALMIARVRFHMVVGAADGKKLPDSWLRPVDEAFAERSKSVVPVTFVLDGEREFGRQGIAWMFSDPARVRSVSAAEGTLNGVFFSSPTFFTTRRVGSYQENLDALDEIYADAKLRLVPPQQPAIKRSPRPDEESSLVIIRTIAPGLGLVIRSDVQARFELLGVRTMLAIERFRVDRGRYPESLGELVPDRLAEVPTDPGLQLPLVYRRIDAATDELRRGYLLYALGFDGVDNGGTAHGPQRDPSVLFDNTWNGFDYPINDQR